MIKPFMINFADGNSAQAVRLKNETEISEAIKKLGLPKGQPTIVLVGGAGGLTDEDLKKLEFLFLDILAPLAENLSANVIDGGTDAGVMRLIGQARSKINASFPLIGIAAEGTVILPDSESADPDAAPLESHHTHFILSNKEKWGDETQVMSDLITVISENKSVLVLLINGGDIARREIEYSIKEDRNILVAKGSGRLADHIADAYAIQHLVNKATMNETLLKGRITVFNIFQSKEKIERIIQQKLKE